MEIRSYDRSIHVPYRIPLSAIVEFDYAGLLDSRKGSL